MHCTRTAAVWLVKIADGAIRLTGHANDNDNEYDQASRVACVRLSSCAPVRPFHVSSTKHDRSLVSSELSPTKSEIEIARNDLIVRDPELQWRKLPTRVRAGHPPPLERSRGD